MRAEIEIDRPIAEVFAYAADPLNDPTWRNEVRRIVAPRVLRPGTTLRETADVGTGPYDIEVIVSDYRPPTRLRVTAASGEMFEVTRDFTALSPARTRLVYTVTTSGTRVQAIAAAPVAPDLARTLYAAIMQANLARLKTEIER